MKRIFLLPGFGEDAFTFNELIPYIDNHELIFVDYRGILNEFIFPFIKRKHFVEKIIQKYNIHPEDKIIGHSMGGYFAFEIREIQGNQICMIAAFNDPNKIIHVMPNFKRLGTLMSLTGFIKSEQAHGFLSKNAKGAYKKVLDNALTNFSTYTNLQLALLNEMNFEPKLSSKMPNPLRIHDPKDRIIRVPDEPYITIEGGHFCHNLFPQETYSIMKDFLNS